MVKSFRLRAGLADPLTFLFFLLFASALPGAACPSFISVPNSPRVGERGEDAADFLEEPGDLIGNSFFGMLAPGPNLPSPSEGEGDQAKVKVS